MKEKKIGGTSIVQLMIIIFSAIVCTLIMSYLDAYERLYVFTRMHELFKVDEFVVFLPAFLALGFSIYSFRQIQQLEAEITRRKRAEAALRESERRYREQSITDDLTKLYNSRHFYAQLNNEIDRTVRYGHQMSLLLLDIDDFKDYNDTYGHIEGDKVLAFLGDVIKSALRQSDSAYRYGGEEFTVILPETEGKEAEKVAERMRKDLENQRFYPTEDEAVGITISIGVSQYVLEEKLDSFIKRTDNAMYKAKRKGKNRVHINGFADEN